MNSILYIRGRINIKSKLLKFNDFFRKFLKQHCPDWDSVAVDVERDFWFSSTQKTSNIHGGPEKKDKNFFIRPYEPRHCHLTLQTHLPSKFTESCLWLNVELILVRNFRMEWKKEPYKILLNEFENRDLRFAPKDETDYSNFDCWAQRGKGTRSKLEATRKRFQKFNFEEFIFCAGD